MYTYVRTCQVVRVPIYGTYQPSSTYLPTYLQYITCPGGVQDHVQYIFLVRHASFINFLFFPFLFVVARGIENYLPTYLPYLAFFMDAFYWFYTR